MRHKRGFSLVELSIVLVVLGLLAGGILAGQSLIRAAELRAVTTEFERYNQAYAAFYDKYKESPGDFSYATELWGAADAVLATCKTTAGTGTQTCNGNGDGHTGLSNLLSADWYETTLFWEHLRNAGLIEGNYNGVIRTTGANYNVIANVNAPASRLSNTAWMMQTKGIIAPFFGTTRMHYFQVGGVSAPDGSGNVWNSEKIFTPSEAWNIDTKLDDGRAGVGAVQEFSGSPCTTTDVAETAEYELTVSSKACILLMRAAVQPL